jgi:hypothetical protein
VTDQPSWPAVPRVPRSKRVELEAHLFAARVDSAGSALEDALQRKRICDADAQSDYAQAVAAEEELRKQIHQAYLTAAASSLDRLIKRAEHLITAAGAIGSLYAALCGLAYSAKDGMALPVAAFAPAVLIAFSIVMSCAYLGFIRRRSLGRRPLFASIAADSQEQRLVTFLEWIDATVLARAPALRLSIVSLGLGTALLPIPFISHLRPTAMVVPAAVIAVWILAEALVLLFRKRG